MHALPYRLLDDNRELYVPELQEVIKPHPHFMLFATQNPAGAYAGRKALSRAFRSRFLELHIEDIPDGELAAILEQRCALAPSYAKKLVATMRELQRQRQVSTKLVILFCKHANLCKTMVTSYTYCDPRSTECM